MTQTAVDLAPVPDHVPAHLVHDFDYQLDPGLVVDPFARIDQLFELPEIFWTPRWGGHWVLCRTPVIRDALQLPTVFSNAHPGIPARPAGVFGPRWMIPEQIDPPDHAKYRRMLAPFFAPKAVELLTAEVHRTSVELIQEIAPRGDCEFVRDYGMPLPARIFTGMLGLPYEHADQFAGWVDGLLYPNSDMSARVQAGREVSTYLQALVEDRAAAPKEDLLSFILSSDVDGRPMTIEETYDTVVLLFLAGLDTVTASMGLVWHHLATHPEQQAALVAQPELVPDAVEEMLRAFAILNSPRVVAEDVTFHGVEMKRGDLMLVPTAASTRDPNEWGANANAIDFGRAARNHIAFGAGVHRCLGSHLARREINLSVTEWLRHIPSFRLDPEHEVRFHGGLILGLDALHLVWDAQ